MRSMKMKREAQNKQNETNTTPSEVTHKVLAHTNELHGYDNMALPYMFSAFDASLKIQRKFTNTD